ncbi:MAG: choice-of-anchor N protein [Sedimentisphaerales bacterium]|nr:choice-of-anchor N protein [Sedimentisphaerales bacterium]
MKILKLRIYLMLIIVSGLSSTIFAVPAFQVYIRGAVAGTIGPDEDTWFTFSNPFDLVVAGAYGPDTLDLTEATLVVSVPKGESGIILLTGIGGDSAVFLTEATLALDDSTYNPNSDADLDLLTNEVGNTNGYDSYADKSFLPDGFNANNHYPFQESVSNFVLYSIGDFDNIPDAVSHYSTEEPIEYNVADGQEKEYSVCVSGFTSAHFEVYGCELTEKQQGIEAFWRMAPGSADATYLVPEPMSLLLLALGGFAIRQRKASFRQA